MNVDSDNDLGDVSAVGEAYELLSSTLEGAGRMVFAHDTEKDRFQLFGAVRALTGRDAQEIGNQSDLLAIVHPDDRIRVQEVANDEESLDRQKSVRFRFVHPDSSVVFCVARGELFCDPGRGGVSRVGIVELAGQQFSPVNQALRLADLAEYLPELVSLHTSDGRALSINAGGRKLLGIERSDDVSRLFLSDLLGDATTVPGHRLLSIVLAQGSHSSEVTLLNQRDGSSVPAFWSGTVIKDQDQRFVVCIARDISRQLETECELRENQRRLTHALDVSQLGEWSMDIADLKFTEQRNRLLADLSRPLATLLDEGRMLREVVQLIVPLLADHVSFDLFDKNERLVRTVSTHPLLSRDAIGDLRTSVEQLPELSAKALASGVTGTLTVLDTHGLKDVARTESELRSLRDLDIRAYQCVPLKVRDRPIGFLHLYHVGTDLHTSESERILVTEIGLRISIALENAHLYRALRDNDSRKNEFLAMLSHELRNPLESLDAGVSLCEHEDQGEGQIGVTAIMMRRQIDKLSSLLDDLLDLSRYEIDKVILRRTHVALRPLIEAVVNDYRMRRDAKIYTWELSLPDTEIYAHADAVRLSQVVGNLLANAVKYGASRGVISVSLSFENDRALIVVSDDGIGMGPDQLSNVFDLFVQGATTIDRGKGGLGMGLTLVKKIVELHGGTVLALSDGAGAGSRFEVTLETSSVAYQPVAMNQRPLDKVNGERLLLVDDNLDTVGALAKLFLRLGYDVRTAHDGNDAIAMALEFRPRLAILDIGLPGASGYEVASALREAYQDDPLFLVALSGYGQAQDRELSRKSGFDHHLLKPVEFRTIALLLSGFEG